MSQLLIKFQKLIMFSSPSLLWFDRFPYYIGKASMSEIAIQDKMNAMELDRMGP